MFGTFFSDDEFSNYKCTECGSSRAQILISQVFLNWRNEYQFELGGKGACVKDKFARTEIRMENMSEHDFSIEVGIKSRYLTLTGIVEKLQLG